MYNILSTISSNFVPKNTGLFQRSITDSEQKIYIPSHNELLKELNDDSKGDLRDEKSSILLQSLQQDTLHFVSASVIGNQRAYQNIIFSKMIDHLNQEFSEELSAKKLAFFSIIVCAGFVRKNV
jgi:hypothetical protein